MDPSWIMFILSFVVAMTTLCELTIGTHLMVATLPYSLYKGLVDHDKDLVLSSSLFLALMLINWLSIIMLVMSCVSGYIEKYVNYDVINLVASLCIINTMLFVNQKTPTSTLSDRAHSQRQFRMSGLRPTNDSYNKQSTTLYDVTMAEKSPDGSPMLDAFEENILKFQYKEFMQRKNSLISCNSIDGCSELLYMHKFRRCCGWDSPKDWLMIDNDWKYETDIKMVINRDFITQQQQQQHLSQSGYYRDYVQQELASRDTPPMINSSILGHNQQTINYNESERLPEFCCVAGSAGGINHSNKCYLSSPFVHSRGCKDIIITDRAHTNPVSYGTGYMYIIAKFLASILHFVCRYYKLFEEGEGIFSHTMPR